MSSSFVVNRKGCQLYSSGSRPRLPFSYPPPPCLLFVTAVHRSFISRSGSRRCGSRAETPGEGEKEEEEEKEGERCTGGTECLRPFVRNILLADWNVCGYDVVLLQANEEPDRSDSEEEEDRIALFWEGKHRPCVRPGWIVSKWTFTKKEAKRQVPLLASLF